jgi:hypothetical protein
MLDAGARRRTGTVEPSAEPVDGALLNNLRQVFRGYHAWTMETLWPAMMD